ncbi:MORN repeat-containing protein 5-like [Diorhabda carinulata]|uniref:MORN repeat-containing protein 5-like n=1 Tax=Diorhabda carinulata TaxID=1163345 RepID=UPI0025A06123|nr:MORN repeat-containing protein 5-like [Diorhabda carinulata]
MNDKQKTEMVQDGNVTVCQVSYSKPCLKTDPNKEVSISVMESFQYIHQRLGVDWENEISKKILAKSLPKYRSVSSAIGSLVERPLQYHITGSTYQGTHDLLGFSGIGIYKFPHGVIYEGEFHDGEFHGSGTLIYPNGQQVEGNWRKGKLKTWFYKYKDGLQHTHPWNYLALPDRAYKIELKEGFKAPGAEHLTGRKFDEKYPPGSYDVGEEGYYDHDMRVIFSKDGKMRRIVDVDEICFIQNNFRRESDRPVGYHPEYYEYWTAGRRNDIKYIDQMFHSSKFDLNS